MNYTREIKQLVNCRVLGDNLNVELLNIDKQIHALRVERAAKVLRIVISVLIIGVGVLSAML